MQIIIVSKYLQDLDSCSLENFLKFYRINEGFIVLSATNELVTYLIRTNDIRKSWYDVLNLAKKYISIEVKKKRVNFLLLI